MSDGCSKEQQFILNKLLDKYEDSKAFIDGTEFTRGIILKPGKQFPEYNYEDYETKENFYNAARDLEKMGVIRVKYVSDREHLIQEIRLNLNLVDMAYDLLDREPLLDKIQDIMTHLVQAFNTSNVPWLKEFYADELGKLNREKKATGLWAKDNQVIADVLVALREIEQTIDAPVTMRVFSLRCYKDSKHFEKEVSKDVVSIIKANEPSIVEYLSSDETLSDKEILAQVGVISRDETFEFCGDVFFETEAGECNFAALTKGACIPSRSLDDIRSIRYGSVSRVLFIENKTNFDEYVLNYRKPDEAVIYHGGFYSPQKAKFYRLWAATLPQGVACYHWGDIDLGGFRMHKRLKEIFPEVQSYMMDADSYRKYVRSGLDRSDAYIQKVAKLANDVEYSEFKDVIHLIIENKKTIEQEVMLDGFIN